MSTGGSPACRRCTFESFSLMYCRMKAAHSTEPVSHAQMKGVLSSESILTVAAALFLSFARRTASFFKPRSL